MIEKLTLRNLAQFTKAAGIALISLGMLFASGCATIMEGSDQSIQFSSRPEGASCDIMREGAMLYANVVLPAALNLEKDKDELVITCRKDGYHDAIINSESDFEGMTLGNLLLGGLIGFGIDFASGAARKYPNHIIITLREKKGDGSNATEEEKKPSVIICAEGHSCVGN